MPKEDLADLVKGLNLLHLVHCPIPTFCDSSSRRSILLDVRFTGESLIAFLSFQSVSVNDTKQTGKV